MPPEVSAARCAAAVLAATDRCPCDGLNTGVRDMLQPVCLTTTTRYLFMAPYAPLKEACEELRACAQQGHISRDTFPYCRCPL